MDTREEPDEPDEPDGTEEIRSTSASGSNIPETTPAQEKYLTASGQRRINLIWESTQRHIAILVVAVTVMVAAFKAVWDALMDPQRSVAAGPAFIFLVAAANLVIGFYFGRTNHTRTGGPDTSSSKSER